MNIIISNNINLPIYEQIVRAVKNEIIAGNIKEEDPLPSIRGLARDLQISIITTNRAYEELEKEGLIYSKAGKGFFVSKQNTNMLKEKKIQGIESDIQELVKECKKSGISKEEMLRMIEVIWDEK
ncbi:MAG: GntR family transcriptional regulator [Lachnospiraceae bacterium]